MLHNPASTPRGLLVITYEYPLSERIRTLLRLEDLFDKTMYFLARENALDHHAEADAYYRRAADLDHRP